MFARKGFRHVGCRFYLIGATIHACSVLLAYSNSSVRVYMTATLVVLPLCISARYLSATNEPLGFISARCRVGVLRSCTRFLIYSLSCTDGWWDCIDCLTERRMSVSLFFLNVVS